MLYSKRSREITRYRLIPGSTMTSKVPMKICNLVRTGPELGEKVDFVFPRHQNISGKKTRENKE